MEEITIKARYRLDVPSGQAPRLMVETIGCDGETLKKLFEGRDGEWTFVMTKSQDSNRKEPSNA